MSRENSWRRWLSTEALGAATSSASGRTIVTGTEAPARGGFQVNPVLRIAPPGRVAGDPCFETSGGGPHVRTPDRDDCQESPRPGLRRGVLRFDLEEFPLLDILLFLRGRKRAADTDERGEQFVVCGFTFEFAHFLRRAALLEGEFADLRERVHRRRPAD